MLAALAIILKSLVEKFIMTIMNFKWTLYVSSINKLQKRWDLSKKKKQQKTSFSPSLCFVEPNTEIKFIKFIFHWQHSVEPKLYFISWDQAYILITRSFGGCKRRKVIFTENPVTSLYSFWFKDLNGRSSLIQFNCQTIRKEKKILFYIFKKNFLHILYMCTWCSVYRWPAATEKNDNRRKRWFYRWFSCELNFLCGIQCPVPP